MNSLLRDQSMGAPIESGRLSMVQSFPMAILVADCHFSSAVSPSVCLTSYATKRLHLHLSSRRRNAPGRQLSPPTGEAMHESNFLHRGPVEPVYIY